MLRTLLLSLLLTIIFSGVYWYQTSASMCRYPLEYSVGEVDDRFSLTQDEARLAISDAESVWEEATGKNLFTYSEDADFSVNFVFDDRQALSVEEQDARARLEALEAESVSVSEQYAALVEEHAALRDSYQAEVEEYEDRLSAYNDRVESYNQEGGAPPEVYEELAEEQAKLEAAASVLQAQTEELNELTDRINQVGDRGNELIARYNERAEQYNQRFGTAREFTQGDYRGGAINIYTFADEIELQQVLVHELGHALSVGHVDDPESIMYHLLGTQPDEVALTEADLAAFAAVCTESSWWRILP